MTNKKYILVVIIGLAIAALIVGVFYFGVFESRTPREANLGDILEMEEGDVVHIAEADLTIRYTKFRKDDCVGGYDEEVGAFGECFSADHVYLHIGEINGKEVNELATQFWGDYFFDGSPGKQYTADMAGETLRMVVYKRWECDAIQYQKSMDYCYLQQANQAKNFASCEKISTKSGRSDCVDYVKKMIQFDKEYQEQRKKYDGQ